jgi:hypothetical protein
VDRREELALLPLADDEAVRLLAAVPEDARGECWWLVRRDGTPVPGNLGGGVELLTEMRLSRPLGSLARAGRLSSFVDALDTLLSGYRKPLGRFVPDGPAPRRYP